MHDKGAETQQRALVEAVIEGRQVVDRAVEKAERLLAGGLDKGEDLAPLADAIRGRVRRVIAYGDARARFQEAVRGAAPVTRVDGGFEAAVGAAAEAARTGDIILLAPACASFDMFSDYAERGGAFKTEVERLATK